MTALHPHPAPAHLEGRWLARLLDWQIPLTGAVGLLGLLTVVLFQTLPAVGGTAIVGAVFGLLLRARALLRQGALGPASTLICGVLVVIAPASVLLIPP